MESGRRVDRAQLAAALELCRRQRAILVSAKLNRLARNVVFIATLMEFSVDFTGRHALRQQADPVHPARRR